MRDGASCTPQRDRVMMGATTPMLEGQPGFAQAWLYGKKLMHLSPSTKMFGDTKKSPGETGVAPQYASGPSLPALLRSKEDRASRPCSKQPKSLGEGKGQGTCAPLRLGHSLSFLGVQVTEGDSVEGVVSSEEQSETQSRERQGQGAPTSPPPQPSPTSTGNTPIGLP